MEMKKGGKSEMQHPRKPRKGIATARSASLWAIAAVLPAFSADVKMQSSVFNRPVTFQENGNVRPLGRVFSGLPYWEIPEEGPFVVRDTSGAMLSAVVDNHIFLKGVVQQNQNSFPGRVKVRRAAGTEIASFGDNGNLYVDNALDNPASCVAPVTELPKWNDLDNIRFGDNCYNYGNNQLTYTFAQPGKASGATAASMAVNLVRQAALNDGLTWVGWNFPGNGYTCAGSGTLVFMTVAPGVDYHWYRLDKANGKWTHKPGGTAATDLDAGNNLISNPLTANRNYGSLNYTDNGGFYCTCGSDAYVR